MVGDLLICIKLVAHLALSAYAEKVFFTYQNMFTSILAKVQQDYEKFETERRECLHLSGKLRVGSKTAIVFMVKGEMEKAKQHLEELPKISENILQYIEKNPYLWSVRGFNEGFEEYVEAALLAAYLEKQEFPNAEDLGVNHDVYIAGLCDMTGELVRIVYKNPERVKEIYEVLTSIYKDSLGFTIQRNSVVREKMGHLDRNIKRLEQVMYENR